MRPLIALAFAGLVLGLAACASTGTSRYSDEFRQLDEDCTARGGVLTPTGNRQTGRPQTDYVCKITGGATRIPDRD